jgi:hypothetical protein
MYRFAVKPKRVSKVLKAVCVDPAAPEAKQPQHRKIMGSNGGRERFRAFGAHAFVARQVQLFDEVRRR